MSVKQECAEHRDPTGAEDIEAYMCFSTEHDSHESINNDDHQFEFNTPTDDVDDSFNTNNNSVDSKNSDIGIDRVYNQIYKFQLEGILGNKNIRFVKSNVGHPMLVVDQFSFHKHSTNPKNGRINWRCSKRRVRGINCSSSCYTTNGTVSEPSPHVLNCPALSEDLIDNYHRKNANISMYKDRGYRINLKADSYTTLKSKKLSLKKADGILNVQRSASLDETFDASFNDSHYSQSQTHVADDLTSLAESFNNEYNWSDTAAQGQETDCTEMSPDNIYEESALDLSYGNNIQMDSAQASTSAKQLPEVDLIESDREIKEPHLTLLNKLNELKVKQELYFQNYQQAVFELENYKKKTQLQIQGLTWKSKVSEIHITSLKSLLSQKHAENKCLKKLVNEMMSKLKVGEMKPLGVGHT